MSIENIAAPITPDIALAEYDLRPLKLQPFGNGLIHQTWKVETSAGDYILQRVQNKVFKQPWDIAHNIEAIGDYLAAHYPDYLFVRPLKTRSGAELVEIDGQYFRVFPFVKNSHALLVAETPEQAFEAARQFGKFTRLLSGMDTRVLRTTIPDFHNLSLRYLQFTGGVVGGNPVRIAEASALIDELRPYGSIVDRFRTIHTDPAFKCRVTHHDTKISNVLFDAQNKAICVIDLDTVMPGYFFSDTGDMMRTYLSAASEEERDPSLVRVRPEFYQAIVHGYLADMSDELSKREREHFFFGGQFMIYMQALRFLTDYLQNDVYYGAKYEDHNLVRAANQVTLLRRFTEQKELFEKI